MIVSRRIRIQRQKHTAFERARNIRFLCAMPRSVMIDPPHTFLPQVHVDDGVACVRVDKRRSLATSLLMEVRLGGEYAWLIVQDGYRGARHEVAMDLVFTRRFRFHKSAREILSSSATPHRGIQNLFTSVKEEALQRISDLKSLEGSEIWEESGLEAVETLEDHEWLPELHSTVILATKNGVFLGGGGAFCVAIVGPRRAMWVTPKGPGISVLKEEAIGENEIIVMGPSSMEALDISVVAASAARHNYEDVVGFCEDLSRLDPTQEDSTVLVVKLLPI